MERKVLIADDDAALRAMLRTVVTRAGHTVTEAGDGNAALKSLREEKFDLVLLDIVMPDKEGIETLLELRRMNGEIPVIVMSGGGKRADETLEMALECGASAVMGKPFELAELRALLAQFLPGG